ncbi:MAG: hypothetical protein HY815_02185 [Candidatus Riflebacteria bacterium]|nr:hypothetical protein [Candidatus Riflebacteria bacterium]
MMSAKSKPALEPVPSPAFPSGEAAPGPEPAAAPEANERALTALDEDRESFLSSLSLHTDSILRNREHIYESIARRQSLGRAIAVYFTMTVLFGGFYGATMGAFKSGPQALVSATKVPLLLFLSLAVATPALYVFNTILGSKIRPIQTIATCAAGMATVSVLLLALSPLSIFFMLSGASYAFLKLFHIVMFFVAGYFGAFVLYDGLQTIAMRVGHNQNMTLLQIWLCLYAYVGVQMAWILRPFLGDPSRPFALFRPSEGNFFKAALDALLAVLR